MDARIKTVIIILYIIYSLQYHGDSFCLFNNYNEIHYMWEKTLGFPACKKTFICLV